MSTDIGKEFSLALLSLKEIKNFSSDKEAQEVAEKLYHSVQILLDENEPENVDYDSIKDVENAKKDQLEKAAKEAEEWIDKKQIEKRIKNQKKPTPKSTGGFTAPIPQQPEYQSEIFQCDADFQKCKVAQKNIGAATIRCYVLLTICISKQFADAIIPG